MLLPIHMKEFQGSGQLASESRSGYKPLLRERMPELDTLRGAAILGVLLYHALYWAEDLAAFPPWQRHFLSLMSAGQFGVNLFFVISGFLITGILVDSRGRADYYPRFYYRRALRILPAYYFTLTLLAIFGLASRGFLLMSALYVPNLAGLLRITMSFAVLWSLGVEEHFYFLWPMAVKRLTMNHLLWLLAGVLVLCPVSRFLYDSQAARGVDVGEYGFYTWNNLDGLALGAMIALLLRRPWWGRQQVKKLGVILPGLAVLLTAIGYPYILSRRTVAGEALQVVPWNLGFGGLLCVFLLVGTSPWKRVVDSRLLAFFAKISYGLYPYHLLFFYAYNWIFARLGMGNWVGLTMWTRIWVRALLMAAGGIPMAYLSGRYLEEPFLRLKHNLPKFLFPQAAVPTSASLSLRPDIRSSNSEAASAPKVLPDQSQQKSDR